jgi:multicomponent Na+:H+ antiporter subunit B
MQEIGVPNIVTSVLASYRAFDTFGEVVVIFTAGMGVLALLSIVRRPEDSAKIDSLNDSMHAEHLILRIVAKILIPFILLYALYVQFHGDYGPGGGFQAGVIFAAAIILYSMLFGMSTARRVINQSLIQLTAAIGVLLYGSIGVISLLNGKNFFDYSALSSDPVAGQHLGILLIELGVGFTVASVMVIIFFNFEGRREKLQDLENNNKDNKKA